MPHVNFSQLVTTLSVSILPLLLGIICHEVAHGYVAWRLGDPTARMLGRLTLNPRVHLDPLGTLFFFFTALFSPFTIGWAKPVPINARYFKHLSRDLALVAISGPAANMILGFLFAFAFFAYLAVATRIVSEPGPVFAFWVQTLQYGVYINFMLAWFNLLPVPPLDGSKLLMAVLPPAAALRFAAISRYGLIIMLALVAFGLLGRIIGPLTMRSAHLALSLAGAVF